MKTNIWIGAALALALTACASPGPRPGEAELAGATMMGRLSALATPDNDVRRDTIARQLASAGFPVAIETFEGGRDGEAETGYNITTVFGPKRGREILLVAHYDAIQLKGQPSMGIVDNAASVVAVISAAERLKDAKLKHRVRILFTDQEELGLLGASAWIKANDLKTVAAVVNADVSAYGDTLMYGLNSGEQSRPVLVALERVCAERVMACKGMTSYPPSDDVAFSQAGAAVVSIGFLPLEDAGKLEAFVANMGSGATPDPASFPEVLGIIHTPRDELSLADPDTIRVASQTFEALVKRLDRTVR